MSQHQYVTLCTEIRERRPEGIVVSVTVTQPCLAMLVVIPIGALLGSSDPHVPHMHAVKASVEGALPHLRGKRFVYQKFITASEMMSERKCASDVYIHFNVDANSPSYSG